MHAVEQALTQLTTGCMVLDHAVWRISCFRLGAEVGGRVGNAEKEGIGSVGMPRLGLNLKYGPSPSDPLPLPCPSSKHPSAMWHYTRRNKHGKVGSRLPRRLNITSVGWPMMNTELGPNTMPDNTVSSIADKTRRRQNV